MNSHKRTDRLFDEAKKLGLDNPMTDDGAPTRRMVSEAISDAEGDTIAKGEAFLAGIDRAVEFHRGNQNDPHGVGNAVIVALTEIQKAYSDAFRPF